MMRGTLTATVRVTVGKFLSSVSARTDQTIEVKFTQGVSSLTADELILQESSATSWMKIKCVTKLSSDTYLIQVEPKYKMSDKKYTLTRRKPAASWSLMARRIPANITGRRPERYPLTAPNADR